MLYSEEDPSIGLSFIMDDNSGKMVSFTGYVAQRTAVDSAESVTPANGQIETVSELFAKYLGLKLTGISTKTADNKNGLLTVTVNYEDEDGAAVSVPIIALGDYMMFNSSFNVKESMLF